MLARDNLPMGMGGAGAPKGNGVPMVAVPRKAPLVSSTSRDKIKPSMCLAPSYFMLSVSFFPTRPTPLPTKFLL